MNGTSMKEKITLITVYFRTNNVGNKPPLVKVEAASFNGGLSWDDILDITPR